jgi:2-polyprenyl-3-methyl-5-hydroxy-6-metoxy-1,4-benzoquinol methylase
MPEEKEPHTFEELKRRHYHLELDLAKKIMASKKGSPRRRAMTAKAYSRISGIISSYDPELGSTSLRRAELLAGIVSQRLPRGSQVLDVGCGSGILLSALAGCGLRADGIDVAKESVLLARERTKHLSNVGLVERLDVLQWFSDKEYDFVVADNVIEHIHPDERQDFFQQAASFLRHGGEILVSTPHRWSGPHDVSKHFLPLGSKARGLHLREYTFTELEKDIKQGGFSRVLTFPFEPSILTHILGSRGNASPPSPVSPACRVFTNPSSVWVSKSLFLEKVFRRMPRSLVFHGNRTITEVSCFCLFPTIVIGEK